MKCKNIQTGIGMKKELILSVAIFLTVFCFGQSLPPAILYRGQTPPGNTPEIFPLSVKLYFASRYSFRVYIIIQIIDKIPPGATMIMADAFAAGTKVMRTR
jgi:hypothetical protein